ncbi:MULTISPECIES: polysaccharide deacetylase family protein [unclassified Bradyrhizobium]|uniref:polysaccharide deacetylase family protein n=1 Tax=unclassified Bradyrhizobium TaxID=2631580 RepID=UPI0028E4E632|nr:MULTISPECIES: polysaccharide deacetylase family protein [unclassified Bradyrhizobium]
MSQARWTSRWVNAAGGAAALLVVHGAAAAPADCPREHTLGTSRILTVDPKQHPRIGLKSFPETLPLHDGEVVLTFDDGPSPPMTNKVLAALAKECVRATFFLVGKPASGRTALVQKIAAEGHTIGHHTYTHAHLAHITPEQAIEEIDRGIAADEKALNGVETTTPSTPFFRFPYFESTPATLDLLASRGIAVFGADLWASDWNPMSPQQTLKLLTSRLNQARKGIILLHDPQPRTVAMLPAFLRYLKDHGYRVVHVVPSEEKHNEQHSERPSPAPETAHEGG